MLATEMERGRDRERGQEVPCFSWCGQRGLKLACQEGRWDESTGVCVFSRVHLGRKHLDLCQNSTQVRARSAGRNRGNDN